MSEPGPAGKEALREEAARWFARMRGPEAEASRDAFDAWLSLGPLQREAYSRAAEIFAMGKLLAEPAPAEAPAGRRRTASRILAAALFAAIAILAAASWPALRKAFVSTPPGGQAQELQPQASAAIEELQTAGQPRSVRLADGSLVELQGATAIAASLTGSERTLRLEHGAARFHVAHERRPFLVHAGGGTVAALGTIFDVALDSGRRVQVRLIEGVIDVSPPWGKEPKSAPIHRLHAGQSISFAAAPTPTAAAGLPPASRLDTGAHPSAEAARDYDRIALADLVRLANQSAQRPIRLADPATGKLRVSGTFRIDDTRLLAQRIAPLFGLADDRSDPKAITLRPAHQSH